MLLHEVVTHVFRYVLLPMSPGWTQAKGGGAGGIRTLDRALQPYNGLANRRLQPLGHSSVGKIPYRSKTFRSIREIEQSQNTTLF